MNDPDKPREDPTEAAIRDALESVERIERERQAADDFDPDQVEVLPPSEAPPSGDPSAEGKGPDGGEEEVSIEEPRAPQKRDPILEAMIQAKNEAVNALEQTQKEAKSLQERMLRTSADFENYKKRQTRERADAVKYANEGLLKELLPVLDNLERALSAARASAEPEGAGASALLEGVEMVYRQFHDALGRFGVKGFSALGQRFDPGQHEAVAQREDLSVPNQTVVEEYQRGYLLHDRLVRPAMVVVSSGGPGEGAANAEADAGASADGTAEG